LASEDFRANGHGGPVTFLAFARGSPKNFVIPAEAGTQPSKLGSIGRLGQAFSQSILKTFWLAQDHDRPSQTPGGSPVGKEAI
jgi:hypothetical protein